MNYNGYEAATHYSEENQIFWDEVINISSSTLITFESDSAKNLAQEFKKSVDFYLEICKKKNKEPKKPMSSKFLVRINPIDHAKLVAKASSDGISLNSWGKEAINERFHTV